MLSLLKLFVTVVSLLTTSANAFTTRNAGRIETVGAAAVPFLRVMPSAAIEEEKLSSDEIAASSLRMPSALIAEKNPPSVDEIFSFAQMMMAVDSASPATIEKTETKEKVDTTEREKSEGTKMPAWELRLFNDPYNKREFVARCLTEICGKSDTESFQIMMQAHQHGMAIVGRYQFEIAELYLEKLKENALLVDIAPVDDE